MAEFDVLIVGGGPAGLSAAMILGRACRSVLLCDTGRPRNYASRALHGFLTRDGIDPKQLLGLGREELSHYPSVRLCNDTVTSITREESREHPTHFSAQLESGEQHRARKVLVASGLTDVLPDIPDIRRFYGNGVHHCPYCDGWEHRGQHLVAYGCDEQGVEMAEALTNWSNSVTLCTGGSRPSDTSLQRLYALGVSVKAERIAALVAHRDHPDTLAALRLENGELLECGALFFNTPQRQRSRLLEDLGCPYDEDQHSTTVRSQQTPVPGVYVAGDIDGDVQFAIIAAAEGATAAVKINRQIRAEDHRRLRGAAAP